MSLSFRSLAALTLATTAAAGCNTKSADARSARAGAEESAPRELVVTAGEYAFVAPDTVPAGVTRVRLTNAGQELHHMQIVRLETGRTLKELLAAIAAGTIPVPWATPVGGPSVVKPGKDIEATLDLTPGSYALLCFMPEGHLQKGMSRAFTVTPTTERGTAMPDADVTMHLSDYAFDHSTPLRAGRQTVRVVNDAAQWHEVLIVRLADGAKPDDVFTWMRAPEGSPPFVPAGGTMALGKGEANLITLDLQAGNYALLCFVPDVRDRKPHVMHGMIQGVVVK